MTRTASFLTYTVQLLKLKVEWFNPSKVSRETLLGFEFLYLQVSKRVYVSIPHTFIVSIKTASKALFNG